MGGAVLLMLACPQALDTHCALICNRKHANIASCLMSTVIGVKPIINSRAAVGIVVLILETFCIVEYAYLVILCCITNRLLIRRLPEYIG